MLLPPFLDRWPMHARIAERLTVIGFDFYWFFAQQMLPFTEKLWFDSVQLVGLAGMTVRW